MRSHIAISTANSPSRKRGFALIIALMLMGFVVLLMMSLTSLVNVELKLATRQSTMFEARQNALLGLNLALAELQRTAGTDQRVTARSDISSGAAVPNAYWTGVWKSIPPEDTNHPVDPDTRHPVVPSVENLAPSQSELMTWLISGNEGIDASTGEDLNYTPDHDMSGLADFGSDPNSTAVYLVGASTLIDKGANEAASANLDGAVIAPKVPLKDSDTNTIGHYAWWVGDEGIKARIQTQNTPDVLDATDGEKSRLAFQLPAATDPAVNNELADIYDRTDERLEDADSFSALNVLWGPGDSATRQTLNEHWHDLSPYSMGLLTDTRWGGFRGDLTLAFENDSVFEKYFGQWNNDSDRFYFVELQDHGYQAGGFPNWSNLRSFYQLKDRLGVINGRTTANMPIPLDSSRSVYPMTVSWSEDQPYKPDSSEEGYHGNSPINAILARLQVSIKLSYEKVDTITLPDESTENVYSPILLVAPLVALYNPYNIHLDPPKDKYGRTMQNKVRWSFTPWIRIRVRERGEDGEYAPKDGLDGQDGVIFYMREVLTMEDDEPDASGNIAPELEMTLPWEKGQTGAYYNDLYPGETRLYGLWENVTRSEFLYDDGDGDREDDFHLLVLSTAEKEDSQYAPDSGHLILDLKRAFSASEIGPVYGEKNRDNITDKFGLSEKEKTYLEVTADDLVIIDIATGSGASVRYMHNGKPDDIAASSSHTQYFNPIVDGHGSNHTKQYILSPGQLAGNVQSLGASGCEEHLTSICKAVCSLTITSAPCAAPRRGIR